MSQHKGTTQKVMRKGVLPFELNTMLNRLKERSKATKASSEKGKLAQEAINNASKLVKDYLNQARTVKGTPSTNSTKPTPETSGNFREVYTQNGNKNTNPIFNTSTNNDSKYTYSGSKDYKNTRYEQPEQTEYSKYKYSKPHHADRSRGATESYEKFKANEAARKPREVPSAGNTKPTTPNKPAPTKVETTSTKPTTPTPTESPTRTPTRTTRSPIRAPKGSIPGVGILSAINANDAIKKAFETGSIAPIAKYGLNLATGGVSGEIEQAYKNGAFEPAPNANPFGAAWDVTKALVNPMNYWNLAKDIATGTAENAVDIYNNFADYAWRDNNVPPPTSTPTPTASEDDNWVIPALPDEISDDSEGDWVIPEKPDEYAKTYVQNKIKEKINTPAPALVPTPTPVVAPRPTPQEVRARKAQQDEILRQKMLETAQNPNSSVRQNMPDYFNSSTTLQNYYLNNPDLWGRR